MSTPASAIARTASGWACAAGAVPAERASPCSPSRWLIQPSAICDRHELPVQSTRTRFLALLPAIDRLPRGPGSTSALDPRHPTYYISCVGELTKPLSRPVDVLKALAHPVRLRILAMLRGGELCLCQMRAVLDLAASPLSPHLADLTRAGLVAG